MESQVPTSKDCLSTNSSGKNTQKSSKDDNKPKPPFVGFGIVCCIVSGFFFSFNALLVKFIFSITPVQMFMSRCFVQFMLLLPVTTYGRYSRRFDILGPPGMLKLLFIRGFVGSSAALLLYMAISHLSVGDAVTIFYSNMLFTSLLAFFCLGEAFTLVDGFLSVLTLGGITLVAQPSFIFGSLGSDMDAQKVMGILYGLGSAICAAITMVIVRKLGKDTPSVLSVTYYSFGGSLTTICILAVTGSFAFPCYSELPYIVLLGLLGGGAQIFFTIGLQYERAGTNAVVRSLQIVVVFILQIIFLHDIPTVLSLSGSGLILLTVIIVALRKIYNHKKQQNLEADKSF